MESETTLSAETETADTESEVETSKIVFIGWCIYEVRLCKFFSGQQHSQPTKPRIIVHSVETIFSPDAATIARVDRMRELNPGVNVHYGPPPSKPSAESYKKSSKNLVKKIAFKKKNTFNRAKRERITKELPRKSDKTFKS